jgi:phosphatidylglycerol---prolipoprotein diacylglyceryl transferase
VKGEGQSSSEEERPTAASKADGNAQDQQTPSPCDYKMSRRLRATDRRDVSAKRPALQIESVACSVLAEADPQLLGFTYWFEPDEEGVPHPVSIRFTGRRLGVEGKPATSDKFSIVQTIEQVVPGSGPIALTARVNEVTSGQWEVSASPERAGHKSSTRKRVPTTRLALPKATTKGQTGFSPIVLGQAPGARVGAWPTMVGLGFVVGLVMEGIVAHHLRLPWMRFVLLALVAAIVGLAGAKIYYLAGRALAGRTIAGWTVPGERRTGEQGPSVGGMCIQGFVIGAVIVGLLGASTIGASPGVVLDVTTPGLLAGMMIGRFGCFFGGCCAGRPTSSRWALWSSNRRVGARRIPTQFFESALAAVLGVAATTVLWNFTLRPSGVTFVAAIALYTLGRQFLFPLRDQRRHTSHGRNRMLVIAGMVVAVDIAIAIHG